MSILQLLLAVVATGSLLALALYARRIATLLLVAKLPSPWTPSEWAGRSSDTVRHSSSETLIQCPNGHSYAAFLRFCPECGAAGELSSPPQASSDALIDCPNGHPYAASLHFCPLCGAAGQL